MKTEKKEVTRISLDVPRILLKYAADLGIDPGEICRSIDFDPAAMHDPNGHISSQQFNQLWAEVIQRANDPYFGLHFGEVLLNLTSGHILLGVMANCSTLREALERFCRYHGLIGDDLPPELHPEGGQMIFRLRSSRLQPADSVDSILAMLTLAVRRLSDNKVQLLEVRLTRQRPADTGEYERIFNARLGFNQPHPELVFASDTLSTPIFLANPILLDALDRIAQKMVVSFANATTWAGLTGETITKLLMQGDVPRLSSVAGEMAISPRHLQNKLQMEGNTFQRVLDSVRKQIATDCILQGEMTLSEIAFLLGFSEQSVFNHVFKRWTGFSPGEYQRTHRKIE